MRQHYAHADATIRGAATPPQSLAGPPGLPLFGHLLEVSRDQLAFLEHCAAEYGDIVPIRYGPRPALLLFRPDSIEEVLVTKSRHFAKGAVYQQLKPLLGNGLFTSEGEFWLRQRRLAQPAFHKERVRSYADVMSYCAERVLTDWRHGDEIDIHAEMMRLTLMIVAQTLFSADIAGDAAPVGRALTVALDDLQDRVAGLRFLVPYLIPTPANLRSRAAIRRLDQIIYRLIAERRTGGEERSDLLTLLLRVRDDDGSGMTDRQLRDEAMTIVLAGHETTALALTWSVYLLAQHPDVAAQLAAEVDRVAAARSLAAVDHDELKFTKAVLHETMRLYPPLAVIGREAITDSEITGHHVAAGTLVGMSQWVTQRDARFYPEPTAFRPDRWTGGLAATLPRGAYFPFGAGPRLCIGHGFAMLEAVVILAALAQRFEFALVPGHPVVPKQSLTLRPKYGVRVVVSRR